uniref:Rho GTPase activating protein 26 n=1 Tax=Sphaeramia orbicularis TaxID=375764 RepID=A0A673AXY1_9TELE
MGLPALEFSDCYLDSPLFRERLKSHELELDKTNKFIKELIKDGKALIQALKNLSTAKRKFADSLNEFKFQCIGDAETDDEICIAKSLQEFAAVLQNLEDERTRMIENANDVLIMPLERFRKEQISAAKEAKKKYDKETEKYCAVLEKHLSLSARKKESHLHEADNQVDNVRQHFYEVSLEYVFKVQEVQERKMFDFVEPLLAFLQGLFTYYHHGYELAKDFNHFKTDLTISIQNTRNRFESTRSEVESLMRKMKENPHEHKSVSQHTMEGYLFVQEKRSFVSSWVKYYCTYHREPKRVTMVLFDPKSGGKMVSEESFILKSCTRRKTDSIEKRFCFDVEAVDRSGVITMQALSEEDRRLWMEAMDGREPVGYHGNQFVHMREIGRNNLYANKNHSYYSIFKKQTNKQTNKKNPKTCADVELDNPEWEIKTITSAIKHYLRFSCMFCLCLPPELDNPEARVTEIHALVHRLPEKNRQMLELLMKHLSNVANHHQQNLMTIANLGVVFGPTLLRPQEETVAAIMDIKFQNIVVEILIEHHEKVSIWYCLSESVSMWISDHCNRRVFSKCVLSPVGEKRNSVVNATVAELQQSVSTSANCNSSSSSSSSSQGRTPRHSLTSNDGEHDTRQIRPSSGYFRSRLNQTLLQIESSLFFFSLNQPTTHRFSFPHCVHSVAGRKARALYACKAEHDSELSFIAGTIFENVHSSREPGWLEGTLDGRTGLIPENYVEFL